MNSCWLRRVLCPWTKVSVKNNFYLFLSYGKKTDHLICPIDTIDYLHSLSQLIGRLFLFLFFVWFVIIRFFRLTFTGFLIKPDSYYWQPKFSPLFVAFKSGFKDISIGRVLIYWRPILVVVQTKKRQSSIL